MSESQDPVTVLVIGEALIDIVVPRIGDAIEHVGGSPANVAKGLARLGHEVVLATHIGQDAYGEQIVTELAVDGVRLTPGSVGASRTPTATARLDADSAASYEFDLVWQVEPQLRAPDGGHVHTGSIAATLEPGGMQVREAVRSARQTATVSYDPNARPAIMGDTGVARARVEQLVAASDVVKVSDEDLRWLYGADVDLELIARDWRSSGPAVVVVTRGSAGAFALVGRALEGFTAAETTVVDTVGAGDSFMSGLISGLLDFGYLGGAEARTRLASATMDDVRPAIERAISCAAITVSRAGANPPTRDELG